MLEKKQTQKDPKRPTDCPLCKKCSLRVKGNTVTKKCKWE